ncbi:MAG TPA: asparaginase [Candidatus Limnocylindrales bacterium]|nr:asparaginase [Candidatus Limnocylindrales bacterium]
MLIPTGGTIAHVARDRLDLASYGDYGTFMQGHSLLERVPETASVADVTVADHEVLIGPRLGLDALLDLARAVQGVAESQAPDGIVITRGTSTLEETSFLLSLTLQTDVPVVLTAAIRPPTGLSEDGSLNFLNAVRVAASPRARGRGVLVVMNDAIFAPRDVTKAAGYRTNAFEARDLGPLGYADADGTVLFHHGHERPHTTSTEFVATSLGPLPRVDIVLSYVGADGALIDAAVAAGAAGIVSAGFGSGKATALEEDALDRALSKGIVVVQGSRVGSGRVIRRPVLAERGIVAAGDLLPWKARILLALALTQTQNPDALQDYFDRY